MLPDLELTVGPHLSPTWEGWGSSQRRVLCALRPLCCIPGDHVGLHTAPWGAGAGCSRFPVSRPWASRGGADRVPASGHDAHCPHWLTGGGRGACLHFRCTWLSCDHKSPRAPPSPRLLPSVGGGGGSCLPALPQSPSLALLPCPFTGRSRWTAFGKVVSEVAFAAS